MKGMSGMMKRGRSLACLFLLGVVLSCPVPVLANLRAPTVLWLAPSGALSSAAGLEVLGETLDFDCDEEQCRVMAVYEVQASQPLSLGFEFLLPVQTAVNARVAGHPAATELTPAGHWTPDQEDARLPGRRWGRELPLYRASFQGELSAGVNRIEVSYIQPLGRYEARYGYFTTSRWLSFFLYELQPLKEWTLARDFVLDISVSMPRRPAGEGLWFSLFATPRAIECFMGEATVTREGERIVYRARRGREFPDHLVCQLGDHDLLSHPEPVDERYAR